MVLYGIVCRLNKLRLNSGREKLKSRIINLIAEPFFLTIFVFRRTFSVVLKVKQR